ncbi:MULTISPECIES: hypothetical protein [Bradyrhizobium]|uniref:hypothetical protein n=1 Tax=Bradyrhizobium TaxID=374 RepID=UPI000D39BBA8|nr:MULTISPECIES: hypothetical protein [Bradyrhizobium]MDE5458951.1 hypothetical protein [Bradyrhizobium sp. CSA112]
MITLTGNSDQAKVAAAILPETISGGVGACRRHWEDLGCAQEFRHRQYTHIAQATVGAVIPSKFEPVWLI